MNITDKAEVREYVATMTDEELRECLSRQLSTRVRAIAEAEAIARQEARS